MGSGPHHWVHGDVLNRDGGIQGHLHGTEGGEPVLLPGSQQTFPKGLGPFSMKGTMKLPVPQTWLLLLKGMCCATG